MAEQSFVINEYRDLHFLLRSRASSVGVSRATIDELCDTARGYAQKVLAKQPQRRGISAALAIRMAKELGLMLVVVEDPAAAEKLADVMHTRDEKRVRQRHDETKEAALS
jgi:hypothetical protein